MSDATAVESGPFTVLAVCTGNIGRSPMIERLMRTRLAEQGATAAVSVASAGTFAAPGSPMEDGACHALRDLGVDPAGFGATLITADLVNASDLVLVATREHRGEVVGLAPGSVRRTFTLHELARIAQTAPPIPQPTVETQGPADRMRRAVAWAAQMRGSVPRPDSEDLDDLVDALGESDDVYRERAGEVAASVERIVPYLLGSGSAG